MISRRDERALRDILSSNELLSHRPRNLLNGRTLLKEVYNIVQRTVRRKLDRETNLITIIKRLPREEGNEGEEAEIERKRDSETIVHLRTAIKLAPRPRRKDRNGKT